jgi:hypothetical protein
MSDAKASGASASQNGSARSRHEHNQGNQDRKYTVEQKAAVLRIRRCEPTAFYEILELQKACADIEIKKAYRKLSLLTHPDKNGHPNADEAFKMVARAFSVLGDKEKRDKFDRFGTDPDSRFANAQAQARENPFAGFAGRRPAGGGGGDGWGEEISPEEMFARFFGGGGFGGELLYTTCVFIVRANSSRLRRRATVRLQLWRRTGCQGASVRRRAATGSAPQPGTRRTAGEHVGHSHRHTTPYPPRHLADSLVHLLGHRLNNARHAQHGV